MKMQPVTIRNMDTEVWKKLKIMAVTANTTIANVIKKLVEKEHKGNK